MGHRVFVVDDEPLIASTVGLILSQQGFEVTTFTNPLKALEAIQMRPPDLLLTDVVMPELSGIELAIVIRETCPSCKVLLISGQLATSDMLAASHKRGHDFAVLTKPVPPVEMIAGVRAGLGLESGGYESAANLH